MRYFYIKTGFFLWVTLLTLQVSSMELPEDTLAFFHNSSIKNPKVGNIKEAILTGNYKDVTNFKVSDEEISLAPRVDYDVKSLAKQHQQLQKNISSTKFFLQLSVGLNTLCGIIKPAFSRNTALCTAGLGGLLFVQYDHDRIVKGSLVNARFIQQNIETRCRLKAYQAEQLRRNRNNPVPNTAKNQTFSFRQFASAVTRNNTTPTVQRFVNFFTK